jgi:hypothetical protein
VHQLVADADLDAVTAALGELRAAGWPAPEDPDSGDLGTAAVLPDRRAERRRRLAEPDLEFRAFNPASITGGTSSTGTVGLAGPAPAGGAVISLLNSNTSVATVPASVTIPEARPAPPSP